MSALKNPVGQPDRESIEENFVNNQGEVTMDNPSTEILPQKQQTANSDTALIDDFKSSNVDSEHLSLHEREWVEGSGVAPSLAKKCVNSLDGGEKDSKYLKEKILKNSSYKGETSGWYVVGVDLAKGKQSDQIKFKPDTPYQISSDDVMKYIQRAGVKPDAFLLPITLEIWEEVAKKHGIDGWELDINEDRSDLGFWLWVANKPKLPLIITEGEKKAGALLTLGYPAVSISGVTNGLRKGKNQLVTTLAKLVKERSFVRLIFDMDAMTKPAVFEALRRLGMVITSKEKCEVEVVVWDPEDGKGIDDLLVNQGTDAVDEAIAKALRFNVWLNENAPVGTQPADGGGEEEQLSQAEALVKIAEESVVSKWLVDQDKTPYVTVEKDGIKMCLPVKSREFRDIIRQKYRKLADGRICNSTAMKEALEQLGAIAADEGEEVEISYRLAEKGNKIYIDLGGPKWRVIEVSAQGWVELDKPPEGLYFKRHTNMKQLPTPTHGGSLEPFKALMSLDEPNICLLLCWLVYCFRPNGDKPILSLTGEAGSGKSTKAMFVKGLSDPQKGGLQRVSKGEENIILKASNSRVVCFDNIDHLSPKLSDIFCALATGGASSSRRTLYEDLGETVLEPGPISLVFTSISELTPRNDFIDRVVFVNAKRLDGIDGVINDDDQVIRERFNECAGATLGILLKAVSIALEKASTVQLDRSYRMPGFIRWAVVCEIALGFKEGTFLKAYERMRKDAYQTASETSPALRAIIQFVESKGEWNGFGSDLHRMVCAPTGYPKPGMPKSANGLTRLLGNQKQALLANDIEFINDDTNRCPTTRKKILTLRKINPPKTDKEVKTSSISLESLDEAENPNKINGSGASDSSSDNRAVNSDVVHTARNDSVGSEQSSDPSDSEKRRSDIARKSARNETLTTQSLQASSEGTSDTSDKIPTLSNPGENTFSSETNGNGQTEKWDIDDREPPPDYDPRDAVIEVEE